MRLITLFALIFLLGSQSFADTVQTIESFGIKFQMVSAGASHDYPILKLGTLTEVPSERKEASLAKLLIYKRPLIDVLKEIQDQQGSVVVDCSVFVQIAALLLNNRGQGPSFFLFPPGQGVLPLFAMLFEMDFGYVRPENLEAAESLQNTSFLNKGQWVLKVGTDKYMGLVGSGVVVLTEHEWSQRMLADLLKELDSRPASTFHSRYQNDMGSPFSDLTNCASILSNLESTIVYLNVKMGKLDRWKLDLHDGFRSRFRDQQPYHL